MNTKITCFVFGLRFAESATIGTLVATHDEGFDSVEEGVKDFIYSTGRVILGPDAHKNSSISLEDIEEFLIELLAKSNDWDIDQYEHYIQLGWTVPDFPDGEGMIAFVNSLLHYGQMNMAEATVIECASSSGPDKLDL